MNPNMMRKLQQMQREMLETQKQLEASTFYGSASGGMVNVEFNGKKEMLKIDINEELVKEQDKEMLQDMIMIAINNCLKVIDEETKRQMSKFTQGLPPGLF